MKIAIIGAGFTGLSAAISLTELGHEVEIFEKNSTSGGLALGFTQPNWEWTLEDHYHHIFTSDYAIQNLAKKVGHRMHFYKPKTSTWVDGHIYQLDSPLSLLKFPALPIIDRIRTGFGLAILKYNPFWQPFEHFTAKKFIQIVMGKKSWEKLWQPLFNGKFGSYSDSISAAWFWSRIFKRSASLGYPDKGFQSLSDSITNYAQKKGVSFHFSTEIKHISSTSSGAQIHLSSSVKNFDKIICTLPTKYFASLAPDLPKNYVEKYSQTGLGAVNLVVSLKKSFFTDGTYWLNINDLKMPFLAVVEHTNFVSSAHYNKEHLLYIGNYLPISHDFFNQTPTELFDLFMPYLRQINPQLNKSWVNNLWKKIAFFAQPVVTPHYSSKIPPLQTPLPNIYLANMQQVYPWDRGTNYAVELGHKVAKLCIKK